MNKLNEYGTENYEYRLYIMEQNKKIESLDNENKELKEKVNNLYSSRGWKIISFLRKITNSLRNFDCKKTLKSESNTEVYKHDYRDLIPYDSFYQDDEDFTNLKTDLKVLTFYLPQFHTFKENDEWWGKGFTEWTNTKKSKPHFEGHYQPREPHDDIGYYKLDKIDTMKKQIDIAKKHGIYGFCFYYYWFSGKRLMEKPVDLLLQHPEIDFPFCLCWANENWTRTWDGLENSVLIKQDYSKDDPEKFIKDIKKYIDDKRYIRIKGKPVILIYNPKQIPDLADVVKKWRQSAIDLGIGEIIVWTKNDLASDNFENVNISDAEFDFAPLGFGHPGCKVTGLDTERSYDYTQMVDDIEHLYINHFPPKPFYYSCTMGWDNSARRKEDYRIYYSYSLKAFYKWLRIIIKQTRIRNNENERFVLVNAWNEWAEGTYLEPDKKYGYANINTLSRAIFNIPLNVDFRILDDKTERLSKIKKKIAIHAHIYYVDLLDEIIDVLNAMPYDYDLYISTDSSSKVKTIIKELEGKIFASKVIVEKYENRGRDVLPFLLQMKKNFNKYDYVCHIHTKKSTTASYGDSWRKYLYNNLFGCKENIESIFNIFEKENIGLIYPMYYKDIADMVEIGGNKNRLKSLLSDMEVEMPDNFDDINFPAGTMFWAKTDALLPLFNLDLSSKEFDEEKGQIDGTIAHAIERSLCIVCKSKGYDCIQIKNEFGDEV